MQDTKGFNATTVDWHKPGIVVDTGGQTAFTAEADDIERFRQDGVVLLHGVFTEWVETLCKGLQRNLDNPQQFAFPCESNPAGEPGRFFDSYCNWQLIPEYLDYIAHSCAASIAGQFMDTQYAQFFHDHAFMKAAGTQRATPWHQDLPYYCIDGCKTASVYVSLDHADADVAVRFVRGSHRWKQLFYPRVFEDGSAFNDDQPGEKLEPVPDIDAHREQYDIAAWSLAPGDAIVFDFRTLHGTGDTVVKDRRRAFSTRWLGDDVTYCERPGEISPPYVDHGMQHGDKMRADWFPILWREDH
ncbi:MAG: phytanoyl-CoA dioxygenase family protein [Gammaproteobacteria bacterium]|nr:phytanoyl-CoA dioxygenase family protein [Gammaproteobacteria bacterium]MDH3857341.1 phytanoyl-CoA dioxygenase family protein [Gammaproteobacteria bacterium]